MCLPMLKECIYQSFSPECGENGVLLEAMMNVMQATFVILQSVPELNEEALSKGQKIFSRLFTHFFMKAEKVNV